MNADPTTGGANGVREEANGPRVLFLVTSAMTVKTFLPPMVRALETHGAEVHVASAPVEGEVGFDPAGLHDLPLERSGSPIALLRAGIATVRLVRRTRPDVLVCATPVASLLGVVIGRLLRVPRVVHLAWGLRSETLKRPARWVVSTAESLTVRLAHVTLANSPSLRDRIVSRDPRVANRVECLGAGTSHGVDLDRFRFAPDPGNPVPVVAFVGRVRRDKGVRELLAATRTLAQEIDFRLLIVGTLEDQVLGEEMSQIGGVEYVPHTDDVPALMRSIDLLVLPTWREGFPNVVLEASATGRPVITTDATGAIDSVCDGSTGLRVPVRDEMALAEALRKLLSSPAERQRMGNAGRAWVSQEFESGDVCRRLAKRLLSGAVA